MGRGVAATGARQFFAHTVIVRYNVCVFALSGEFVRWFRVLSMEEIEGASVRAVAKKSGLEKPEK